MFLGPFLMSFAIILFILVLQFMALYMNEIFGKGLDLAVLGKLFYYAAGRLLLTAMPIAMMAGSLMAFGSMGEHYELAALKSCGIGLIKTVRSIFVFAFIMTAFSLVVSFDIIPRANLKFFSLLYDVQRKKPEVAIKPGYFYSDIDGYVIRVSDKNAESGALYDVIIYNHTENRGNVDIIQADSAFMNMQNDEMRMILYHGTRHEEYKSQAGKPESYPYGRTYFDSLYYRFNLSGFKLDRTEESAFKHQIVMPRKELNQARDSLAGLSWEQYKKGFAQLARYNKIDSTFIRGLPDSIRLKEPYQSWALTDGDSILGCFDEKTQVSLLSKALVNMRAAKSYLEFMQKKEEDHDRYRRNYDYEYHLRMAMPINCIFFIILGASLGAIIRKGGLGPPALAAIVFFMLFYILLTYGKKLVREGIISPEMGAWGPVVIIAVFAVLAFIWANNSKIDTKSLIIVGVSLGLIRLIIKLVNLGLYVWFG